MSLLKLGQRSVTDPPLKTQGIYMQGADQVNPFYHIIRDYLKYEEQAVSGSNNT